MRLFFLLKFVISFGKLTKFAVFKVSKVNFYAWARMHQASFLYVDFNELLVYTNLRHLACFVQITVVHMPCDYFFKDNPFCAKMP